MTQIQKVLWDLVIVFGMHGVLFCHGCLLGVMLYPLAMDFLLLPWSFNLSRSAWAFWYWAQYQNAVVVVLRSPIHANEPSEYNGMLYRTSNRVLNNGIKVIILICMDGTSQYHHHPKCPGVPEHFGTELPGGGGVLTCWGRRGCAAQMGYFFSKNP